MPETPPAVYWDACVPLSYINGMPERMPILDALLASSAQGEIQLYTSELSRVEVAFSAMEKEQRDLDEETERRIDSLWANPEVITMVDCHMGVGLEARRLMRLAMAETWSLKPADAIHLATAQWLSKTGIAIDAFHTYDTILFRYRPMVDFEIMEPAIAQPRLID